MDPVILEFNGSMFPNTWRFKAPRHPRKAHPRLPMCSYAFASIGNSLKRFVCADCSLACSHCSSKSRLTVAKKKRSVSVRCVLCAQSSASSERFGHGHILSSSAHYSMVTVGSQYGHSRVYSRVTVGSLFFPCNRVSGMKFQLSFQQLLLSTVHERVFMEKTVTLL